MKTEEIKQLFGYLEEVIKWRTENPAEDFDTYSPEYVTIGSDSQITDFIVKNDLTRQEIIILLMAFTPRLDPTLLRNIYLKTSNNDLFDLCATSDSGRFFLPSVEVLQYILGGSGIAERLAILNYFDEDNILIKENIIAVSSFDEGSVNTKVIATEEALNILLLEKDILPKMSADFPAEQIMTSRSWDDLILPKGILSEIQDIQAWCTSSEILMKEWKMEAKLKPGFRVLFYGDPGTGKTLAASLLAKYIDRPVFRIDLSMLVSKYIGETEKQLAKLFDRAENKNWILFFDEADSIFGKRTNVRDAHDKYANQEVSYLLQRIESFSGLIILASNYKNNMDKAFMRRFQNCIRFSNPKYEERLRIWQQNLPIQLNMENIDIKLIANSYELTGANIMNVIQDICLKTIASGQPDNIVSMDMLLDSIKKEYAKEDRIFA
ncbi:ATP-binding protein [Flavobacterium sp. RHBU_3]|uniref:ATP-binding protein n=1 Tax=Flavobacterium sp. RHBU_3 TaxID=3391184 RepID=UPI003984E882